MPLVRVNVPSHMSEPDRAKLRGSVRDLITRTWAKRDIYVAIQPMDADPGDPRVFTTIDLREGRGRERERGEAFKAGMLALLGETLGTTEDDFILIVRQLPGDSFFVSGGNLQPLEEITPPLDESP